MSRSSNAHSSSSRDALFGAGAAGYTPLQPSQPSRLVSWNDDEDSEPDYQSRNVDADLPIQQIRQQQYDLMEEQDRGLEALSEVISRQKNLAHVIGNEVTYQNELIDDITDHVDRTRDRLVGQTNSVRTIDRKDSTGRYWLIIILLLITIIIIISV